MNGDIPTDQDELNIQRNAPPSQAKINKMMRVLKGEKMRFTLHILMNDGIEYEFQSDHQPNLAFDVETRTNVLRYDAGASGYTVICPWDKVIICRCEKNLT